MSSRWRNIIDSVTHSSVPSVVDTSFSHLYYCGDDNTDPISRDLTIEFGQARRTNIIEARNRFNTLDANIKMLKMNIQSTEDKEKSKTGHYKVDFTKLWLNLPKHNSNLIQTCENCNKKVKQITTCSLCSNNCCNLCCKDKIDISTQSGYQKFPACINCYKLFMEKQRKEQWILDIENSKDHPLFNFESILQEVEVVIVKGLPKYEEIATKIKQQSFPKRVEVMPEIFLQAEKYEKILNQFFDNYELGLSKAKSYKPLNNGEKRLQQCFLRAKMLTLQKYYPKYRILRAELREIKPLLIKKIITNISEPIKPKIEKKLYIPVVSSLEPSVVPTTGGDFLVHGNNFHDKAKVFINGLEAETTPVNNETLYVKAESYPISSDVIVFVRNPDGDSDNISLYYVDPDNEFYQNNNLESENFDVNQISNINTFNGWGDDPYEPEIIAKPSTKVNNRIWGGGNENNINKSKINDNEIIETSESSESCKDITLEKDIYIKSVPQISTITPILSPPTGIEITITGYSFAKQPKVMIGNIVLDEISTYKIYKDTGKIECTIICNTPSLQQGIYSVSVINPKGGKARMENILVYIPFSKWQQVTNPETNKKTIKPSRNWG